MNKLDNHLMKYKTNNINMLEFHYGNFMLKTKFDKSIDKSLFESMMAKFVCNKYKEFENTFYSYENHFYDTINQNHIYKDNFNTFKNENGVFITYKKNILNTNDFSCKQNYNKITQKIMEFIISPDIKIQFIICNKKYNIKVLAVINENVDITIKHLKDLI